MKHINTSSDYSESADLRRDMISDEELYNNKNGLATMKMISAWSNTFPRQLASFVLFQNGTGVVFLNKHLKKLSVNEPTAIAVDTMRDQLAQRALQLLKQYGYLGDRRITSTRVNRLKNGSGWMVQFDSPYILTFVKPHHDGVNIYEEEEEVIKSTSHLAFAIRNADAKELKIVYIQDNPHCLDLP